MGIPFCVLPSLVGPIAKDRGGDDGRVDDEMAASQSNGPLKPPLDLNHKRDRPNHLKRDHAEQSQKPPERRRRDGGWDFAGVSSGITLIAATLA
jgi:hypothetical protein